MAAMDFNTLKRYGIKEVMNVSIEAINLDTDKAGKTLAYPGDVVLQLDSLKVSTLEFTAEQVYAQGGWGNPRLIGWDFGKEITLTLEDALISPEFMRIMMGGRMREATASAPVKLRRTENIQQMGTTVTLPTALSTAPVEGMIYKWMNTTTGKRGQMQYGEDEWTTPTQWASMEPIKVAAGDWVTFFYDIEATGLNYTAAEITISPEVFPGTYRIYGETMIRGEQGKDTTFLMTIPRAKISSSITLTMQAEGDPATFEMTIDVLRDESGDMLTLVPYELVVT